MIFFLQVNTFQIILREVDALAAQHERISEKLKKEIWPTIAHKSNEFRTTRKRQLADVSRFVFLCCAHLIENKKFKIFAVTTAK